MFKKVHSPMSATVAALVGVQMALLPLCPAIGSAISFVGPGGGGWIECVCPSRHVSGRLFVGCDVGGFYFSADGGRTYEIRNCGLGDPMVETIAEHPTNPNLLIVGGNGGLYRSEDLGRHWRRITNGLPPPLLNGHSLPIKRVVWDETDVRRVYAATGCPRSKMKNGQMGHLYRSDDGGCSWRMVVASDSPLLSGGETEIFDLAVSSQDGASLMVLTSRGLFKSTDAGEHWQAIGQGLPERTLFGQMARSLKDPNRVYLTARDDTSTSFPREASVWRSDDGGVRWRKMGYLPLLMRWSEGKEQMDPWGRMCVATDPRNPDVVWCGGLWFRPGLCRSSDGGQTWTNVLAQTPNGWLDEFWWQSPCSLAVSSFGNGRVFVGTSSAVFASEDNGASWQQRYSAPDSSDGKIVGTGLDVLCVSEIVPDRSCPNRFLSAFYDVGLMITEDGGHSWTRRMAGVPKVYSGACFTVAQAPREANRWWAVFGQWGGKTRGVPAISVDGGRSWTVRADARGWSDARASQLCVLSDCEPYALAAVHQRDGLVLSADGGCSWTKPTANDFSAACRCSALVFSGGRLYAGTRSAKGSSPQVWVSDDKGASWSLLLDRPAELDGEVTSIAVRGQRITVAVKCCGPKGGCLYSSDGGASWRVVFKDNPWNDVNAVALTKGAIVVASRNARWHDDIGGGGVFASFDEGKTWTPCRAGGFDRPEVMSLADDPFCPTRIWAGTWGNSLAILDLKLLLKQSTDKNNTERLSR